MDNSLADTSTPGFPKIWQSNGTIQKILESNIQYVEGYCLTDKYPDHYILNYDIENFRIYINNQVTTIAGPK